MRFELASVAVGMPLALACLLPEERMGSARTLKLGGDNGLEIGSGDRFSGGTIAPRGVGTQSVTLTSILSVEEIISGLNGLKSEYDIETFTTPYTTYEGAAIVGGKIGGAGTADTDYHVYLNGGIHARERGGPDGLLYFLGDLLYADKNGIGLQFGSQSYTNAQVKTALSVGIVFVPLSNPDGVAYDQSSNSCWRKNRNPASSTSGVGVDLNRNFDFLWDLSQFASSVRGGVASTRPASEVFHGTAPFSEPETKAIKWVMDTFAKVRWFVDLHSYTGDILYSWGSDENQSEDPAMNFLNHTYDGVRGVLSDTPGSGSAYGEYVPADENAANVGAARRVGAAMTAAAQRSYAVVPASALYATSGASDDYSFSRHFADPAKNLIHGYTVEFGFGNDDASCPFYPTQEQHNANVAEISAGFMELLLAAVEYGLE
ncbi:Zn-dependent exopeptidase [Diplocarpon rosae]|nr:Zn-dependent exopeptidase [Diplocarpon rosae]